MMNSLEDINEKWEKIGKGLDFLAKHRPRTALYKESLEKGLNALAISFQRMEEALKQRQHLIDVQCKTEKFGGPLHEEYHAVTAQLDVDLDLYLAAIKTAMNRLPPVVVDSLGHKLAAGIPIKSFGSFAGYDGWPQVPEKLQKLAQIVQAAGKEIDSTIHEYRDKNIEHIRRPGRAGLSTNLEGVRRTHQESSSVIPKETTPTSSQAVPTKMQPGATPFVRLDLPNGDYAFYVHLQRDSSKKEVSKGDLLGQVSDGGSGHFEKYGAHGHTFTSPGLDTESLTSIPMDKASPGSSGSLVAVTDFLLAMVEELRAIVQAEG